MPKRFQQLAIMRVEIVLNARDCPTCGVIYGISEDFEQRRRQDGEPFYSPAGHGISFRDSELEIAKRKAQQTQEKLSKMEERYASLQAETDQAWATANEKERELGRITRRIHAGVCPHCNRTFQNLQRHMDSKHNGPEAKAKHIAAGQTAS